MWKNNTLYFGPDLTSKEFDSLDKMKKLEVYLQRVQESYLDVAKEVDHQGDVKRGFASILLSCSAIEALAKIYYISLGPTARFNKFCKTNIQIEPVVFAEMDLYDNYRCGLAHEGRIKKKYSVSYETEEDFISLGDHRILNPRLFRERYLDDIGSYFKGVEGQMGAVVEGMFKK